jgi:hypothetical protein
LRRLFERLQKYQLRLNPIKCSFEVRIGKLLDFVVSSRGIEVNLDKAKAVEDISIHNTKKKIRIYVGRLNYIAWFISQLTVTCELIFCLLRKKTLGYRTMVVKKPLTR